MIITIRHLECCAHVSLIGCHQAKWQNNVGSTFYQFAYSQSVCGRFELTGSLLIRVRPPVWFAILDGTLVAVQISSIFPFKTVSVVEGLILTSINLQRKSSSETFRNLLVHERFRSNFLNSQRK